MKSIIQFFFVIFLILLYDPIFAESSIYDFKVKDIQGKDFDFSTLKGKVILIVNVASKCGFTSQYSGLEDLYKKYKDKGFIVIGFPSNDFKNQEPGTNKEIASFCKLTYGVDFPMMSKVHVIGKEMSPIYKFLVTNSEEKVDIRWNFEKFIISKTGKIIGRYSSYIKPEAVRIKEKIEENL